MTRAQEQNSCLRVSHWFLVPLPRPISPAKYTVSAPYTVSDRQFLGGQPPGRGRDEGGGGGREEEG